MSVGCSSSTPTFALATGRKLPDEPVEVVGECARPRPPFFPSALADICAHATSIYAHPPWKATATFLIAGLDPPQLTRAKDGKSLFLHAFGYGTGRATIVVDEAGRWDANELGAKLVHVARGAAEEEEEKAHRRVPGLLAAFARGDE